MLNGTPNADQIVTEPADEQEAAAISIPRIPAASAVVWEVSTWSTRSVASMNDVDADERRRIIGLRGMAGSSAWEVTPSSANDVRGNTYIVLVLLAFCLLGKRRDNPAWRRS